MGPTIRVLHVEDSESDVELIDRQLRNSGYNVIAERVQDADAMRAALTDSTWDLTICDYRMPGFDAPAALAVLQETGRDIPFVVISGTIGEEAAVEMLKAGANDYLMKDNLKRLAGAVDRELREVKVRAERRHAVRRLEESERQLALAVESTELGVFDFDPRTGKLFYSGLARRHLHLPADVEPTLGNFLDGLHPEDRTRVDQAINNAFHPNSGGRYAVEYRTKFPVDGQDQWISALGRVLYDSSGAPERFLGVFRDITELKHAERELQLQTRLVACITEQSTDCIMLHDGDGRIMFTNPETERVFGYTTEELKAHKAHNLLHNHYPDGRPFPVTECKLFQSLAAGEVLRDHEDVFFHKDGTAIDIAVSGVPLELNGTRIGHVFTVRDITERKRTERALRQSDERFRRLFDADIIGILVTDGERILESNDHFLGMLGYTRQEFFSSERTWRMITPPDQASASERAFRAVYEAGACPAFEKEYVRKDGSRVPVLIAAVHLNPGAEPRILGFVVDLTERKNLEIQFRQAQKLESIGQLAGGVAHDFNNLLTVIMGYAYLALDDLKRSPSSLKNALGQITAASERAAALTRQLLTFSRRNEGHPRTVLLDELIANTEGMLLRLIGENIEIVLAPGAEAGYIHADPGLIEQVILNLAVNARDAMPNGGRLFIETSKVDIADEVSAVHHSVPQGRYISLRVTDTGTGMIPDVLAHLFEPFFTTKPPGSGTGLGLSTVYGIVKQSGGAIKVDSQPGRGSVFRVLLPAVSKGSVSEPAPLQDTPVRGSETILLVEDDEGVRKFVHQVLELHGYKPLDAATGADGVEIARHYAGPIHLLLTDVVLPELSGAGVIQQFRMLRKDVPILCMSGYPAHFGERIAADIPYLQKPFTQKVLLTRIRGILDSPPGSR